MTTGDIEKLSIDDTIDIGDILLRYSGVPLSKARKVAIMLHGRGASADSFIGISKAMNTSNVCFIAPNAERGTWYPQSFLAPVRQNEPWLTMSLNIIRRIVEELTARGFRTEQLYFIGFSQGACLSLEYVTRNAAKYGGVIAFTGGLIGESVNPTTYSGNFDGTTVFIGTSDVDTHVPLERVNETEILMSEMGATVLKSVYQGMTHTINSEELEMAGVILRSKMVLG
ncbi:MAG: dienelactone hydrolase family protein [Candidatus Kapabacteria bacterium]|nr:dienelactone hydrolase family protein [Candidatus Kapabacteria bacterium]